MDTVILPNPTQWPHGIMSKTRMSNKKILSQPTRNSANGTNLTPKNTTSKMLSKRTEKGIVENSRRLSRGFIILGGMVLLVSILFFSALLAALAATLFFSAVMARLVGLMTIFTVLVAFRFCSRQSNNQFIISVVSPSSKFTSFFPQTANIPPRSAC